MPRRSRLALFVALVAVIALAVGVAWGSQILTAVRPPGAGVGIASPPAGNATASSAASAAPSSGASVAASPSSLGPATPAPSPSSTAVAGPLPPSPPPPRADALGPGLEAALEDVRTRHGIPGISATVLFGDGTAWTGVTGFADLEARRPVRADTAFSIASMSKTFTAAVVLDLVDEGELRLDEPAVRHLPGVEVPGVEIPGTVTVRMLLDHTSGLSDYFLSPTIDRALTRDRAARWDPERALSFVGKPYFPPGKGWRYSNTNYLLLGLVVEDVTGRSIAEEVRDRFLDPLELSNTHYQADERAPTELARGYRFATAALDAQPIDVGDRSGIAPYRALVTAAGAAGSLASTSDDVAQWGRALYAGDALSPKSRALMIGAVATTRERGSVIPYGLGVQAIPISGFSTLGHSGRFAGFRGVLRYLPAEDLSIAILTNQSRTDPNLLVSDVLRVIYPNPGACNPCAGRS